MVFGERQVDTGVRPLADCSIRDDYDRGVTDDVRAPGLVFGEIAEDYDRVRPGYPDGLIDDVLDYSGLAGSGRSALEVGAGTGKATVSFAERGVPIVALEPDPAMAAVLARHVAGLGQVRIVPETFEQYRPEEGFGLLYCGDAWHWTQPESRWQLASQALAPGGALALFWHYDRIDDPAQRQRMFDVIAEITPSVIVDDEPIEPSRLLAEWPASDMADRPDFDELSGRIYPSKLTVSGADYLTHMATRSQIRLLTEPARARLFEALTEVFADEVTLAIYNALYLARRTSVPA